MNDLIPLLKLGGWVYFAQMSLWLPLYVSSVCKMQSFTSTLIGKSIETIFLSSYHCHHALGLLLQVDPTLLRMCNSAVRTPGGIKIMQAFHSLVLRHGLPETKPVPCGGTSCALAGQSHQRT